MKLIHRVAYYLGGFTIGLILLFFFLGGKRASCDYGPDARTLKNIRTKARFYSEESLRNLNQNGLDTAAIGYLLQNGDVLFSESNTELDSCKQYVVKGKYLKKELKLRVENCETAATLLDIEVLKER
jgi:hypothetical protein